MRLNEYQELSKRTMPHIIDGMDKSNYAMGLAGEAGEVVDVIKKEVHHGHPKNVMKVKEELGDLMHYVVGVASMYGLTMDEVCSYNIEKLAKRFPEGFDKDRSINRIKYGVE